MIDRRDDFAWLRDFDGSERDSVDGWQHLPADERARIERLDAEVFGVLAAGLEPVTPSAGLRQRLLDAAAPAQVVPISSPRSVAPRWAFQLAAALAAVALGSALWMFTRVESQSAELARLEQRVEELGLESASLAALRQDLAAAKENLRLVGGRGVEVCPLRPVETVAPQGAHGLLFLAEDHQHWYLRTAGLEPVEGRWYRVWFVTADGSVVPAGNLVAGELDLGSPTMPSDTRAVRVTLESEPEPMVPQGDTVLYGLGEEMIQLI